MPESKNYNKELSVVMFALADSIESATDSEVIEEIKQSGQNLEVIAQDVRKVLLDSLKTFRKRRLIEAKERHKMNVLKIETGTFELPATSQERRELLFTVLNDNPYMAKGLLTAHFRDFKDLSDDDVESMLRQLQQLGALKNPNDKDI